MPAEPPSSRHAAPVAPPPPGIHFQRLLDEQRAQVQSSGPQYTTFRPGLVTALAGLLVLGGVVVVVAGVRALGVTHPGEPGDDAITRIVAGRSGMLLLAVGLVRMLLGFAIGRRSRLARGIVSLAALSTTVVGATHLYRNEAHRDLNPSMVGLLVEGALVLAMLWGTRRVRRYFAPR